MGESLRWLIERPDLGLRLLSGDAAVQVEWVHGIELDDPTPFLRGGEFVLTTGQRLPRSHAGQSAYAARLVERRVAALGFGTGVRFTTVPRALAQACAQLNLPLVEVPLPTPFVAITRAFAERVAQQQRAELQATTDFQRRLTQIAVRSGEPAAVRAAAAHLGRPIAVIDRAGRSVDDIPAAFAEQLLRAAEQLPETAQVFANADLEIHPLAGQVAENAWLATTARPALSQLQRLSLHHIILVVTLLREMPAGLDALRSSLGRVTLGQLEQGAIQDDAIREFGLLPHDAAAIVALPPTRLPSRSQRAWFDTISAALAAPDRILGPLLDGVLTLVPGRLVDVACEAAAVASVHLGIARAEVGNVNERIRAAGRAAQSARRRGLKRLESGTFDLATFLGPATSSELRDLIGPALRRVEGQPDGAMFLRTVRAFLRVHGRLELAATDLGVHRHTVAARMKRVAEVAGLDVDDPDVRAVLWLALAARE